MSEFLGDGYRHNQTVIVKTSETKLSLPFEIVKGNPKSEDDKGIITATLYKELEDSTTNKIDGISITSKTEFEATYGSDFSLELAFEDLKKTTDFYVDFYAKDDYEEGWWWWEDDVTSGKLTNVHCGRLKVVFDYVEPCVCDDSDWPTLPNMVNQTNRVRYGTDLTWEENPECYHYALQELKNLGYWVKTERWNKKWDGTKELNDDIFQLHLDADVAGMKKGPQEEMFKKSLIYLKSAMKSKTPVMVGLDYHSGYANDDLITDHFAVITGCGRDGNNKLYFDVTDNAYAFQRYYCNCSDFEIKSADGQIIISQLRESKKI